MIEFCCNSMKLHALDDEEDHKIIDFSLSERCFAIFEARGQPYGIVIKHCPFCGAELPEDLIDERYDLISEMFGKECCDVDPKDIPEEFNTDEWWKKRGL